MPKYVKLPGWCRHKDCQAQAGHGPLKRYCEKHAASLVRGAYGLAVLAVAAILIITYVIARFAR